MSISILIEGPDGSGKTYLAERLIENLKASYIHGTKVPKRELDDVCERMIQSIELLTANNFNVITDRFVYSQAIYEQIFENDDRNDHNHMLEWYSKHFDCQIICIPEDRHKYLAEFANLKASRVEEYNVMTDVYDAYHSLYFGGETFIKNKFFQSNVSLKSRKNCFVYDRFTGLINNRYTINEFCEMIQ